MVREDQILGAMRLLMERMKLVVEPSGAAGLAAVLAPGFAAALAAARQGTVMQQEQEQQQQGPLKVGVVLCGGNLDFKDFFDPARWQPAM